MENSKDNYQSLIDSIRETIESARNRVNQVVNNELLRANWEVGKYIVEYEQDGNEKPNMVVHYLPTSQEI